MQEQRRGLGYNLIELSLVMGLGLMLLLLVNPDVIFRFFYDSYSHVQRQESSLLFWDQLDGLLRQGVTMTQISETGFEFSSQDHGYQVRSEPMGQGGYELRLIKNNQEQLGQMSVLEGLSAQQGIVFEYVQDDQTLTSQVEVVTGVWCRWQWSGTPLPGIVDRFFHVQEADFFVEAY